MKDRKVYEPGIYSITNEEYHSSYGISRSGIIHFKRSPKHFWHKYINQNYIPQEATDSMKFGTAFHAYVLEPEKFDLEYVIKPEPRENLPEKLLLKDVGRERFEENKILLETERKKRKQEDLDFYHFSLGKQLITQEDFNQIKLMKESIFADEDARLLIVGAQYEKSIYWIDPDTNLLCKCRPDILFDNYVVDLKSTKDASYRSFQYDFYDAGYYIQLAMIQEGLLHTKNKLIKTFVDLAVEKSEPHAYAIYEIDQTAIERGLDEFKHHLFGIKQCLEKNEWPGYGFQQEKLTLPAYA